MLSSASLVDAQKTRPGVTFKRPQTTKQRYISDITMDGFQAETFAGANKLTWKTSHEKNVLGFKIWRDDQGERVLVNEETISGSLLRVADGVLQTGYEYSFYDLTDSTNVYYWLEAINGNSQSRMFGPIYPQGNFDPEAIERESETIAELRSSRNRRAAQTETVDFTEPVTETENFSSPLRLGKGEIQTTESAAQDSLLTNDPNALKIEVRGRGLFRVDAQNLASNGFSASQSTNWKLFSGGVEQPMIVNGDGSIEFYGQGIDTVQTDANVYWLMTDTSAGKRIKRVSQKFLSSAKNTATRVTVEKRDRINRASSILNGGRENWFGALIGPSAANQTLLLSDIADESRQTATVSIDLQGLTAIPHQVSVLLNGVSLGQIGFMYYDRKEWSTTVPLTRLVEGANTITMQTLGGSQDFTLTESIRISYPRDLRAQNNRLDFSVPGGQAAKLSGFASSEVRMLDVTNPLAISELAPQSRQEADGTYSVTINSASNARLLTAFGTTTGAQAVASVQRNNPSDLKNLSNQGKFLVVAPVEYKELLRPLCDARTASGIRTQFVDVEDIYDEFSGGVKSAEAIRSFLQYAKQNWAVKPDYVMFVGDASVDPRNYSGMGGYVNNRVPTMFTDTWNMETVSDEMMVDFNGDSVGELAVGRLPAKNENELGAMLEKIMNTRPLTRQEINTRGVHFISDTFYDYNFMNGSRTMASSFPSTIAVNYSDFSGADAAGFRANIVSRINSNPAIVNYFGHASVSSWSNAQIFRSGDVSSLTNSQSAPFMALINCLNGDYAETNLLSVAEAMMKRRSGGASAVWAASGYNGAFEQEYMTRDFYQKVFTGMPLGEAARQTKALYPTTDLRRTYVFFGDPTQSLVIQ